MTVNYDKFNNTLQVTFQLKTIVDEIKPFIKLNDWIVDNSKTDFIFSLKHRVNSKYHFSLIKISNKPNGNVPIFTFKVFPLKHTSNIEISIECELKEVLPHFKGWVSVVSRINEINFSDYEDFTKVYSKEFFDLFEIVDDDAETHPFNTEQQVELFNLLDTVERRINEYPEQNEDTKRLIEETSELKHNITRLSKKKLIKGISNLFARIKGYEIQLLLFIWVEAAKYFLKLGFDNFFHAIGLIK